MKRPGVNQRLAKETKERYGNRCAKCGRNKTLEVHHIKPLIYQGTDDIDNLIPLCRECHKYAPNTIPEFFRYLSSPYQPHISASRDIAKIMCKYFEAVEQHEIEYLRKIGAEKYFETKFESMFRGMRAMAFGFDDVETCEEYLTTDKPEVEIENPIESIAKAMNADR